MDSHAQARRDLAAALRWAARLGLNEGTCNHFSLQVDEDRFLVNPWGPHWREMKASDLLLIDSKGTILEGDWPIEETALHIHTRIHIRHPHAAAVFHTHMPYATALCSVEGGRIEPCVQTALRFYNRVAYDEDYNGLADGPEEGDRMAARMEGKPVLFLANHGVIVTGPTVAEAFDELYYLERAAQAQVLAMSTGRPLKLVPGQIAERTARSMEQGRPPYAAVHFSALVRMLAREEPEFAG
ncbi:MAG: aldolase [Alphaproteobacteria bacterium]|nr:aldolase [Alphaproteobacteria bacterium]